MKKIEGETYSEGHSRVQRKSFIILVIISLVLSAFCILYTVNYVNASNHKWCSIVDAVIVNKIPKPDDPKAHPSRQRAYEYYVKFVKLDKDLGCRGHLQ